MVREGPTIETANLAAGALKAGMTGVMGIDAFVAAFVEDGAVGRSSVWSPDLDYPVRFRPPAGT